MNESLTKIKGLVEKYKSDLLIKEETETSLTVIQTGEKRFPVTFHCLESGFKVQIKGLHKLFLAEEDALDYFASSLSDDCRLKVVMVGDTEYKWYLEVKEGKEWITENYSEIALFPFWKKKSVEYYQNNLINYDK